MIAIIGAGITGLSTAYHLKERPYHIFEQQQHTGGLCRSTRVGDFTFDYTGHLLHIRNPVTHQLIKTLLPGKLKKFSRRAAIYYKGQYIPYPFQANTYGLPKKVIFDCVMGFIDAYCHRNHENCPALNFREWILENFGYGIARHFLLPYNEKLWQRSLDKITSDWVEWSIPLPSLEAVIKGALGMKNSPMGYNAEFFFPIKKGIEILPQALSKSVKNISLSKKLLYVNLSKKSLCFEDGEICEYDKLVSTIPLPSLLAKIEDLPVSYRNKEKKLSFVSVQNLNLGINRERLSDFHWIYFPEPAFPFYRIGFYSNFSAHMAPKKTSSLYIEVSTKPRHKTHKAQLLEACIEGLKRCGILKKKDAIIAEHYANIEFAYVTYDMFRMKNLPLIFQFLNKNSVYPLGRFGSWMYASMEDCLLQGKAVAEAL